MWRFYLLGADRHLWMDMAVSKEYHTYKYNKWKKKTIFLFRHVQDTIAHKQYDVFINRWWILRNRKTSSGEHFLCFQYNRRIFWPPVVTRCVTGFAMVLITNLLVVHSPPQVEIIKYFLLHPTRQTKSCNIERYNIKSHRHQFNNLILKSTQA